MEGVRASARAVRETAPRSFARPWPRLRPRLADPRWFLQPPPARLESLAHSPDSQQHPTPSSPDESPACVLGGGPHATPPGTRVPPAANLLVRVCFFGHFPVHLDACPAAGSLAPFIFLCARPPSSHLRHLLIWWWRGELEMKGAPRQAGKRGSPSAGRGLGRGAPGSGRPRPAGRGPRAPNGRRGEIWEGDPEGESSRKTSTLGAAGGRPAAVGPGRGRPRGPGQSGFRVALGGRGRCAWEAVQGAPSEPHLATPPIYSILDSQRRQQEEEVGRKR